MAHELQNLVWLLPTERRSEKLVLLALCDRANKKNNMCWPSHKDISVRTGLSNKTVRRAIKTLCEMEIISYVKRRKADGSLTSNLYTIHAEKLAKCSAEVPKMTEKPLNRTFNRTNSNGNSSTQDHAPTEVRLISEDRKRKICHELGYDFQKLQMTDLKNNTNYAPKLPILNKSWIPD